MKYYVGRVIRSPLGDWLSDTVTWDLFFREIPFRNKETIKIYWWNRKKRYNKNNWLLVRVLIF